MVKTQTQTQTARELHTLAVQRAAEHGERVAQAQGEVQQAAALLAALDRQQQVADNAVTAAQAAVKAAQRDLTGKQAAAILGQGTPAEAEAVAAVSAAQERFDATVRYLSEAQADAMDVRATLDGQREQLQDQHAAAKAAHSDLEQLHGALVEHVAHARDAAGREAAAEILSERAALRARIVSAREQIEAAYRDMLALSSSIEERMRTAGYADHISEVRQVMADTLEPRRDITENFAAYLEAMTRCQGRATDYRLANAMEIPARHIGEALSAGHVHNVNLFLRPRQIATDILEQIAKQAGEE